MVQFFTFLLFIFVNSNVLAKHLQFDDEIESCLFGTKIQNLIRQRDLDGLKDIFDKNNQYQRRKKFIILTKNKKFDQIFSNSWRESVLNDEKPCQRVGYRGFMIANGAIWFDYIDNQWRIIAINNN